MAFARSCHCLLCGADGTIFDEGNASPDNEAPRLGKK
jgi:hypothetical protein